MTRDDRRSERPAGSPQPDAAANPLWLAALAVEADAMLAAEMAQWDAALGDGLAADGL